MITRLKAAGVDVKKSWGLNLLEPCGQARNGTALPLPLLSREGHAVAQLVEALSYKAEGRGFDSRWRHWNWHKHSGRNMALTEISTRNVSILQRADNLTTSMCLFSWNLVALKSLNRYGLSRIALPLRLPHSLSLLLFTKRTSSPSPLLSLHTPSALSFWHRNLTFKF
jgi:hypothetical protein